MRWLSEVAYQNPKTRTYLGSPSLLRLGDGSLLATHDYFGPGCPRNSEGEECLTSVYRSDDDGISWTPVIHIVGAFWSSLFEHDGAVFLLGTSAQYGHIVIRRSTDGGYTWTKPMDEQSGLLFRGGFFHTEPNYHCAPVPVVEIRGRIFRAFEDNSPLNWPKGFKSCVISCDSDADLLEASNWTMTDKLPYDQKNTPGEWGANQAGWLEGNVVPAPNGEIWNIMRVNSAPAVDKAAIIRVSDEGRSLFFDSSDFIDFPGGMSKFTIRQDASTGQYFTLVNNNTDPNYPAQRNVLSIYASLNLRNWEHMMTIMEDDLGLSESDSANLTGFQYTDWQFDGDDIIYLVRTAYDGAHSYHDSNRITFGKVKNYRKL